MNDQKVITDVKSAIKAVMMDFIFEPMDNHTLRGIESTLAETLSELIDIDTDFRVTAEFIDKDAQVIVYVPNENETGYTKLTARYTDCPALSEEALMENRDEKRTVTQKAADESARLFDIAMAVIDG